MMPRPSLFTLLRAVLVVGCALLGASVLPRMGAGASVDLVLLVVVAGALMRGAASGAFLGLAAGWVVDLVPPGGHPLGATALSLAAAGALVGTARRFGSWSPVLPVAASLVGAVVVQAVRVLVAAASDEPLDWVAAGWTVVLTVVAGLLVVPLLMALERALVRRRLA